MTDLTPALTDEEWKKGHYLAPGDADFSLRGNTLQVSGDSWDTDSVHNRPDDLAALIALANHALPEGDPRRIEKADIDAVFFDLAALVDRGGSPDQRSYRLLFKLAALLPSK
jgi:hypothetical protein